MRRGGEQATIGGISCLPTVLSALVPDPQHYATSSGGTHLPLQTEGCRCCYSHERITCNTCRLAENSHHTVSDLILKDSGEAGMY